MLLALFVSLLFVHSLVSRRLEQTLLTAPILFTSAGLLTFVFAPESFAGGANVGVFLHLAEAGLVLLLFTEASRTDLKVLLRIRSLPARLLSVGMLSTILLGAIAARLVLPELSIWEAGILAAILAPTDAGLGQVIVSSERVPMRVRQALNVEAGLNDGLAVPFLLFFMALAGSSGDGHEASLTKFVVEQLGYGVLVGLALGLVGGWLVGMSRRREWLAESWQPIAVVALPVLCLLVSDAVGASMFIAAFVAGLSVQIGFREVGDKSVEFAEEWGQVLNLAVFFLFGLLVARELPNLGAASLLYAVLSLTIVRMLPVALSMLGSGWSGSTVAFMGWFGPRGLASIVLGLVYLEHEQHLPGERSIRWAVMTTVGLSIFVHGLTAMPGIDLYERKLARLAPDAPEHQDA